MTPAVIRCRQLSVIDRPDFRPTLTAMSACGYCLISRHLSQQATGHLRGLPTQIRQSGPRLSIWRGCLRDRAHRAVCKLPGESTEMRSPPACREWALFGAIVFGIREFRS